MPKPRFTQEQIADTLKQAQAGTPVTEVCGKLGITQQTFSRWKRKLAGMDAAQLRRLKQMEEENKKLKARVAELTRDKKGRQRAGAQYETSQRRPTDPQGSEPVTCRVIRAGETYAGKQGFDYFAGISAESAGSGGLCMHLLTIPPGGRARAHLHQSHETTIYVIQGESEMWYGDRLQHRLTVCAGEFLYIPAGMPHLPANLSDAEPCTAVLARTDPNEQESVVLLPSLERFAGPSK